jgi:type VI secretion system secreted protein VgrG
MVMFGNIKWGASTGWLGIKQLCKGGYTSEVNSVDSDNELEAYDTDLGGRDLNKNFKILTLNNKVELLSFGLMLVIYKKLIPNGIIIKKVYNY